MAAVESGALGIVLLLKVQWCLSGQPMRLA
jgi:hypothetical protein